MKLAYIDESDHVDAYFTTALVISSSEVTSLIKALDECMIVVSHTFGIDINVEIHGYSILNGTNGWESIKSDYDKQKVIFTTLVDIILNFDIGIFYKGIMRSRFVPNYGDVVADIHHAALVWNLERIQDFLEDISDYSVVIADEIGSRETHLQRAISNYRDNGTFGWDAKKLNRILDTIYFSPSNTSRLLQAADILSYAHKISRSSNPNLKAQQFFDLIWNRILSSRKVRSLSTWS